MTTDFESIPILDNFYQTSSFFPMPVVLVSTVSESGMTNLGPYSLVFPHIIAGESGEHAMMFISRATSNTAENIRRTGFCALNFIPDDKKYMECCVELGWPGESTEEKMKHSIFSLIPSMRKEKKTGIQYPEIVEESVQIMECTWDDSFPLEVTPECNHFLLRVDEIFLKNEYREAIIHGMEAKKFPKLPIDYGFRDNMYFWFTEAKKPYKVQITDRHDTNVNSIMFAAKRFDPSVQWTEEAAAKLVRVPRIFLKRVFAGVVEEAKKEGITVITGEFMDKVRDKRSDEKD
ncbi:MAG: hypothetical protein GF411_01470 [Candidatus Lokiarchaeota archaeon]|nr:hypothetical protein [Candidatus Lokiarchaeota archaeon]